MMTELFDCDHASMNFTSTTQGGGDIIILVVPK